MSIEYDDDGGGGGLVCFAQHDGERRRVLFANKIFYFLGLAVVVLVKFVHSWSHSLLLILRWLESTQNTITNRKICKNVSMVYILTMMSWQLSTSFYLDYTHAKTTVSKSHLIIPK